jgi:hypothetical protein
MTRKSTEEAANVPLETLELRGATEIHRLNAIATASAPNPIVGTQPDIARGGTILFNRRLRFNWDGLDFGRLIIVIVGLSFCLAIIGFFIHAFTTTQKSKVTATR